MIYTLIKSRVNLVIILTIFSTFIVSHSFFITGKKELISFRNSENIAESLKLNCMISMCITYLSNFLIYKKDVIFQLHLVN